MTNRLLNRPHAIVRHSRRFELPIRTDREPVDEAESRSHFRRSLTATAVTLAIFLAGLAVAIAALALVVGR